ncbi:MAG TPA: hypothetical protein VMI54_25490 [Polyangiaceae bacterium]|nr:hypothetical protein [Polyangiaceae bacterium]
MTGRRSLIAVSLLAGALAALAAPGCGENGQTPTCPELSLYDINSPDAANDPKIVAERAAAVDAGCMTDLLDASINEVPADAAPGPSDAAPVPSDAAPNPNDAAPN